MERKKLENYIKNAKYMMVISHISVNNTKPLILQWQHRSVRIHNINFIKLLNVNNLQEQRVFLYSSENKLKRPLLNDRIFTELKYVRHVSSSAQPKEPARSVNSFCKNINLQHCYFCEIYYSHRCSSIKSKKVWNATLYHPFNKGLGSLLILKKLDCYLDLNIFLRNVRHITQSVDNQEVSEGFLCQNEVNLESQYSKRRNYYNTNSLHT